MKVISIKWWDAFGDTGWISEDALNKEIDDGVFVYSVGMLFREDAKTITLIQSKCSDLMDNYITIPKQMIDKIEELCDVDCNDVHA